MDELEAIFITTLEAVEFADSVSVRRAIDKRTDAEDYVPAVVVGCRGFTVDGFSGPRERVYTIAVSVFDDDAERCRASGDLAVAALRELEGIQDFVAMIFDGATFGVLEQDASPYVLELSYSVRVG